MIPQTKIKHTKNARFLIDAFAFDQPFRLFSLAPLRWRWSEILWLDVLASSAARSPIAKGSSSVASGRSSGSLWGSSTWTARRPRSCEVGGFEKRKPVFWKTFLKISSFWMGVCVFPWASWTIFSKASFQCLEATLCFAALFQITTFRVPTFSPWGSPLFALARVVWTEFTLEVLGFEPKGSRRAPYEKIPSKPDPVRRS